MGVGTSRDGEEEWRPDEHVWLNHGRVLLEPNKVQLGDFCDNTNGGVMVWYFEEDWTHLSMVLKRINFVW